MPLLPDSFQPHIAEMRYISLAITSQPHCQLRRLQPLMLMPPARQICFALDYCAFRAAAAPLSPLRCLSLSILMLLQPSTLLPFQPSRYAELSLRMIDAGRQLAGTAASHLHSPAIGFRIAASCQPMLRQFAEAALPAPITLSAFAAIR